MESLYYFLFTIGIAIVIALVFKFWINTKLEQIFQRNYIQSCNMIFRHICSVDVQKQHIYDILENQEQLNSDISSTVKLSEYDHNDIVNAQDRILIEDKNLEFFQKQSMYITLNQYITIKRYVVSAVAFAYTKQKYNAFISPKSLWAHMYYAKEIIHLFGHNTSKTFRDKWITEFNKHGGINNITEPHLEPGDMIGFDWNLKDELFFRDSRHEEYLERFTRIENLLNSNKS